MSVPKINIAVVGLGFGAEFVPIYKAHPNVGRVGICDPDPVRLDAARDRHGITDCFSRLEEVLADGRFDAVHLLTPVPLHVEQTLAVLEAGMHCACAVPMATDLESLRRIVAASRTAGKNYMMMETQVYCREYLLCENLLRSGKLGKLTFLRGTYFQDLEGNYPAYWRAQPPMHYATHAIGPVLALAQTRATKVCAMGSGHLRDDIQIPGENPFPLETGIFRMEGTDVAFEITKSWFQVGRQYCEAFSAYGEEGGFEWQQLDNEDPVVFRLEPLKPGAYGRWAPGERVPAPLRPDLLPTEIHPHIDGWHGGSHPHLVHEFVSSIVEGRPSRIDAVTSADWTAPGICAHESALNDGAPTTIPSFA